jgi:hypothetical protein
MGLSMEKISAFNSSVSADFRDQAIAQSTFQIASDLPQATSKISIAPAIPREVVGTKSIR